MAKKANVFNREDDGDASFNMTPMIDVTFQLIIFFILTSQVASAELAQLTLHRPWVSPAREADEEMRKQNNVIVNILSADAQPGEKQQGPETGKAASYKISGKTIEIGDEARIGEIIQEEIDQAGGDPKQVSVEIRSDRRVHFSEVLPVMLEATNKKISRMHLTAKLEAKEMD